MIIKINALCRKLDLIIISIISHRSEVIIYCSLICLYYQKIFNLKGLLKKKSPIWMVFSQLKNYFFQTFISSSHIILGNNMPAWGSRLCLLIKTWENYFVRRKGKGFFFSSRPSFSGCQVNFYNRFKSGWGEYGVSMAGEGSINRISDVSPHWW